jgi:nicotinamide-nucleotide amidase
MDVAAELKRLMMQRPRLTLAAAESLTAGHVQARIASASGASRYFLGGVTAYSLEQKVRLLGVNRAHARRVNSISQRVAVEMALGVTEMFGAYVGVATTGYAESSKADKVREPFAFWAVCHRLKGGRNEIISGEIAVPGASRVVVQERVSDEVLRALVVYLRELR